MLTLPIGRVMGQQPQYSEYLTVNSNFR